MDHFHFNLMYGSFKNTFKENIQINHTLRKSWKNHTAFLLKYTYYIIFIYVHKQ